MADQELVTAASTGVAYWEGSVTVEGSARGRGYVELTGYAARFRAPIALWGLAISMWPPPRSFRA